MMTDNVQEALEEARAHLGKVVVTLHKMKSMKAVEFNETLTNSVKELDYKTLNLYTDFVCTIVKWESEK